MILTQRQVNITNLEVHLVHLKISVINLKYSKGLLMQLVVAPVIKSYSVFPRSLS